MTALEKDEGRKCQIVTRMISEILPQDSNLTEIRIKSYDFFYNCDAVLKIIRPKTGSSFFSFHNDVIQVLKLKNNGPGCGIIFVKFRMKT